MIRPTPSASRRSLGTRVHGPAPPQHRGAAQAGGHHPGLAQVARGVGGSSRPALGGRPSAGMVSGGAQGGDARAACRSCSSWTVHSTSVSPPSPSLRWVRRSAPRGSRSASTRAFISRMSRTCVALEPPSGLAQRVDQVDERRRPGPGRRPPGGPAAAPGTPRSAPTARSRRVGRQAAHERPALPSGRRSASTRARGRDPARRAAAAAPATTGSARRLGVLVAATPSRMSGWCTNDRRRRRRRSPSPGRRGCPSR